MGLGQTILGLFCDPLWHLSFNVCIRTTGLPWWLSSKESPSSAEIMEDTACGIIESIPGWGRSPGGGHSYPLQYSCLENIKDRGAWWVTVHGVAKRHNWYSSINIFHICYYFLLYLFFVLICSAFCGFDIFYICIFFPFLAYQLYFIFKKIILVCNIQQI